MRSYRVRLGETRGGTTIHYFERVSRVFVILPIDSGSHALCTGYLEYDVQMHDGELQKVLAVCQSLAPLR
ncbi:MAG: hypothetical protein H6718_20200 [Polyangiaceae bacterium]|nr:hypothetical protein [Myxococcales bacterium]MCB9587736.1 hypothetical protein [Polyangiaceae bacterium]